MDVLLTLILSCSLHPDDNLVQALAYRMSVANQFFVGDLSNLNTYDSAKSAAEGLRIANAIKTAGGRPAVGFMAVPLDWAPRFGRAPEDLFDGCTNISIGTAMLSDFSRLCTAGASRARAGPYRSRHRSRVPTSTARACILRRLETEMNIQGIAQHVLPVVAKLEAAPQDRDTDSPAARAPVFPDNSDTSDGTRDWSSPRLFVSSPPASSVPARTAPVPTPKTSSVPRGGAGPAVGGTPSRGHTFPDRRAAPGQ